MPTLRYIQGFGDLLMLISVPFNLRSMTLTAMLVGNAHPTVYLETPDDIL